MADIVYLAIIVVFFIVCVGYVHVCGRIIGPDEVVDFESDLDDTETEPALERAA